METSYWREQRRMRDESPGRDSSLGHAFSQLTDELSRLLRLEIQLAKTEMAEKASGMGKNIAFVAAGAVVGVVGLTVLAMALGFLLGSFMPDWLGFAISAALFLGAGAMAASTGLKGMRHTGMTLDRTSRTLQEDRLWMRQEAEEVKRDPAHLGAKR